VTLSTLVKVKLTKSLERVGPSRVMNVSGGVVSPPAALIVNVALLDAIPYVASAAIETVTVHSPAPTMIRVVSASMAQMALSFVP
jgi:hypothetical protein